MTATQQDVSIMTEDNRIVHPGDRVYNYYDMWPGTIQPLSEYEVKDALASGVNIKNDIWFYVAPDKGGQNALLNGARICTIAFARRRGFVRAAARLPGRHVISIIKTMGGTYNVIGIADGMFVLQGNLTEQQLKELLQAGKEALK